MSSKRQQRPKQYNQLKKECRDSQEDVVADHGDDTDPDPPPGGVQAPAQEQFVADRQIGVLVTKQYDGRHGVGFVPPGGRIFIGGQGVLGVREGGLEGGENEGGLERDVKERSTRDQVGSETFHDRYPETYFSERGRAFSE